MSLNNRFLTLGAIALGVLLAILVIIAIAIQLISPETIERWNAEATAAAVSATEIVKSENTQRIKDCQINREQVTQEVRALVGLNEQLPVQFSEMLTSPTVLHEDNENQFPFQSAYSSGGRQGYVYGVLDISDCRVLLSKFAEGVTEPLPATGVPVKPEATPRPTLTREQQILKDCDLDPDTPIEKREDALGGIYVVTLSDRCVALDTTACMAMGEVSCR